jgi:hypothetical protein
MAAEPARLHLRAESPADIAALSALLQDTTVRAADIAWEPRARRLTLIGNRFRHEDPRRPSRVRCGLVIAHITDAARRSWPGSGDSMLALLAIRADAENVHLHFAAGALIRLGVETLDLTLDDLSGPWKAVRRPVHD